MVEAVLNAADPLALKPKVIAIDFDLSETMKEEMKSVNLGKLVGRFEERLVLRPSKFGLDDIFVEQSLTKEFGGINEDFMLDFAGI